MSHPIVHFEIGGPDRVALQGFYADLFGWEIKDMPEANYGMVSTGVQGGIEGGISGTTPEGPSHWVTLYIQVEDLQAHLDRVETLGGRTLVPPTPIPGEGAFAWFSDPQGNTIGLFSRNGA
jgi:predicted enzyme related to lactoylglutathione lyase